MKKSIQQIKTVVIGSVISSVIISSSVAAPVAEGAADELVKKLDSESYLERQEAQVELGKWLRTANKSQVDALKEFSEKTDSPEVRERLRDALDINIYEPVPKTKGFMGIQMDPIAAGVVIADVVKGQAADKAGIKRGDKIIELDGKDLTKMNRNQAEARDFLHHYVKTKKEGEKLELKLNRNGNILEKKLKLGNYEEYLKKNQLGFQGNQPGVRPRMQQLELNVVPGPNGRFNVVPKQLAPEDLAEMQKQMNELKKMMEEQAKRQKAEPPKLERKPVKPADPKK